MWLHILVVGPGCCVYVAQFGSSTPNSATYTQQPGKVISANTGPRCPEGSRKLRFPDYVTVALYSQEILLVLISGRG